MRIININEHVITNKQTKNKHQNTKNVTLIIRIKSKQNKTNQKPKHTKIIAIIIEHTQNTTNTITIKTNITNSN